jgi:hypothetical protein
MILLNLRKKVLFRVRKINLTYAYDNELFLILRGLLQNI